MAAPVLVLNAGSSSLKAAVFDTALVEILRVEVTGIGTDAGALRVGGDTRPLRIADAADALAACLGALARNGVALTELAGAGHRIVHGGSRFTAPCRIDSAVEAGIRACVPLAPLHNPHHLAAIRGIAAQAPGLAQVACFDTAFHATNPDVARTYALPKNAASAQVMRYGFHGISYQSLVQTLPRQTGAPLPERLLAMHLGNGASLCAILDGRSVATTMGYSPLSGLTMGTRTGDIDAAAVLSIARVLGIDAAERLLTRESGLLGLSGLSADMRSLSQSDDPAAVFAIAHFCYWAARHAGSMAAAMGGVDAIAFTGGIGENAGDVRDAILAHLRWLGDVPVHIVTAAEERHIARQTRALIAGH